MDILGIDASALLLLVTLLFAIGLGLAARSSAGQTRSESPWREPGL